MARCATICMRVEGLRMTFIGGLQKRLKMVEIAGKNGDLARFLEKYRFNDIRIEDSSRGPVHSHPVVTTYFPIKTRAFFNKTKI